MEFLDIYDENGIRTGRVIERSSDFSDLREGERLLLVHVCVFNSAGMMLLQRRQLTKDRYPGMWDVSAGGFVSSGEDSFGAIRRELSEELGMTAEDGSIYFVCREPFSVVLDDFYAVFSDIDVSQLQLQEEEVMEAAWFSEQRVLEMLHSGELVDYSEDLIKRMFAAAGSKIM